MRATWDGHYLSGRTPELVAVTVSIERRALRIDRVDTPPMWWEYATLRLTQGLHTGEHVRLERADGDEALVIADRAFLESVHRLAPDAGLARAAGSVRESRVQLWIGGTIAAVIAAYFWVLPAVAGLLALRIPVGWERELGDAVADEVAPADAVCDDSLLLGSIDGIVSRLAASLPEQIYEFRVSIVDDSLVNALAAPGGRIIVMRGLLEQSETPEELAGVLAHEMQHVQLRHGTRATLRQLPLQAVLGLVGGGGAGAALLGTLGALRYARGDEIEADSEGMRLLLASRVDPRGMLDFFETLEAEAAEAPAAFTYLSTHPNTAERRARLAGMAAETAAPVEPIATAVAWSDLTTRCRSAVPVSEAGPV